MNEEEKKKTMMTPRPKKKTMMTPQPPSSSPPRKSKGTQTENDKEKEEDEEDERKNFVKKVDAMIRFLKKKTGRRVPAIAPEAKWEARVLEGKKTSALPTPAPCGAPHPRPGR